MDKNGYEIVNVIVRDEWNPDEIIITYREEVMVVEKNNALTYWMKVNVDGIAEEDENGDAHIAGHYLSGTI